MATRVAFFLVLGLYMAGLKIPGRLELLNPDVEVTGVAKRIAAKRPSTAPIP